MPSWVLSSALRGRGDLYSCQKNYAAAVSDYNRVIELESDFDRTGKVGAYLAGHYKQRCKAHFYLKHYEQALADFAKALELRPDDLFTLTWIPPEDVVACPDEKFRTGMRALYDKTFEILKSKPHALHNAGHHNGAAWLLATCPDVKLRDPALAVAHAKKAVELAPGSGGTWNTLGVAQYRNGDWKAAVEALMKSVQFGKGGNSFDFFFLAVAHWQLNEKDKARAWYDQAIAWMDKHNSQDKELKRFRVEATDLLGLAKAAQTQNKKD